jgi:hypothetical protein
MAVKQISFYMRKSDAFLPQFLQCLELAILLFSRIDVISPDQLTTCTIACAGMDPALVRLNLPQLLDEDSSINTLIQKQVRDKSSALFSLILLHEGV